MKNLLIVLVALTSISAFAQKYPCNNNQFVQVLTLPAIELDPSGDFEVLELLEEGKYATKQFCHEVGFLSGTIISISSLYSSENFRNVAMSLSSFENVYRSQCRISNSRIAVSKADYVKSAKDLRTKYLKGMREFCPGIITAKLKR